MESFKTQYFGALHVKFMGQHRALTVVLRLIGLVDTLALVAVLMPRRLMNLAAVSLGLDALPPESIVGYLVRSASAMYALHGLTVLYVSFDVVRYWDLIRFLAIIALFHGMLMLGIDIGEGLPRWWLCLEGPCFAATGAVVLWLQHRRWQLN